MRTKGRVWNPPLSKHFPQNRLEERTSIHRVLFCDLGNVILQFDFNSAIQKIAELSGRTFEDIRKFLFWPGFQERYEKGKIGPQEFLDCLRDSLKVDASDEQLALIWNDVFSENRQMVDWLEIVIGKFPIWGISNTNALHYDYIHQRYPIVRKLNGWVLSYKIGCRKPEPEIFKVALKKAGVSPQQAFFVDDLPANVQAAEGAGICSQLFRGVSPLIQALQREGYPL